MAGDNGNRPAAPRTSDLLRLALLHPTTAVVDLVERLRHPDGRSWWTAVADALPDELGAAASLSPTVLTEHWKRAQASGANARTVVYGYLAIARSLLHDGILLDGADPRQTCEDLLELAEALPDPWATEFARAAVIAEQQTTDRDPTPDDTGIRIGQYRLLEPIGRGGMGVVYRAIQDGTDRLVALKLIRPELVGNQSRLRLRIEARSLARLQHPAIAQILEIGMADGLGTEVPFLAMELIDGTTLCAHAEAAALSTAGRIKLFCRICDAVQHAHDRGVIHRDLKPGNILVTEDGQPKLVDFGVGGAVDDDRFSRLVDLSGPLGTLAYMSPEQAVTRTCPADVRADVYSLGATLYQLLCAHVPLRVGDCTPTEAARRIAEVEPVPLGKRDPRLAGDLEAVATKALAKDPVDRYSSVAALADDLRRHLRCEPLHAVPRTAVYVLGKLVRRRRGSFAAAGLVVLAVGIGIVLAARSWREAVVARRQATQLARHALWLNERLGHSLRPRTEVAASLEVARDLVEGGDVLADDDLREILCGICELTGDVELAQGELEAARRTRLEVLAERRALAANRPADRDRRKRLGVALVKVGDVAKERGDLDAAAGYYRDALEIDEDLVRESGRAAAFLDNLCWSHVRMGDLAERRFELGTAHDQFARAREVAVELTELRPADPGSRYALAHTNLALADILRELAVAPDRRLALGREALAILRARHRESDEQVHAARLYMAMTFVAREHQAAGDLANARALFDEAIALARRLAARDPTQVEFQLGIAKTHKFLAQIETDVGDTDAAMVALDAALEALDAARRLSGQSWLVRSECCTVQRMRLVLLFETGRTTEAGDLAPRLLDDFEQLVDDERGGAVATEQLASLLLEPALGSLRDPARARDFSLRLVEGAQAVPPGRWTVLAEAYDACGQPDEARAARACAEAARRHNAELVR